MSLIETRSMARKRKEREQEADVYAEALANNQPAKRVTPPPPPPIQPPPIIPVNCIQCDKTEACIGFARCKHMAYCVDCFRARELFNKPLPVLCVRCHEPGWNSFFAAPGNAATTAKAIADLYTNTSSANILSAALGGVIDTCKTLRVQKGEPIKEAMLHQYKSAAMGYDRYPLLAVDQCEALLSLAGHSGFYDLEGGYILRNVLVSFCRYPWLVSVDLGSHGVCYHGNMGEMPDLCGTFRLTRRNISYAMKEECYF